MSLIKEIRVPNPRVLNESFYITMESHIPYLRSHKDTQIVEVTGQTADKYMGDFYGLLLFLHVEPKYHYLISRTNGLNASTDYDGLRTKILMPSMDAMNAIFAIYSSVSD